MMVRHLFVVICTLNGSMKRQVWLRRPGASRAPMRGGVLIIHSLEWIASGMLGSVETSKIQANVCESWVRVSGGGAEFIKTPRS